MIIISLLLIDRNRCTQASTSSDSAGFLAFLSEQLKDAVQCSMRCQSKFCQLLQHCRKNLFSKYLLPVSPAEMAVVIEMPFVTNMGSWARCALLTCAQKLAYVSLIYRTKPKTKKWKK